MQRPMRRASRDWHATPEEDLARGDQKNHRGEGRCEEAGKTIQVSNGIEINPAERVGLDQP